MLSVVRVRLYLAAVAAVVGGLTLASAQQAAALPLYLGNIGNFQVGADEIRGQGFDLGLGIDQDSGEKGSALPVGEIRLDTAQLDGLVLEKAFDLSGVVGVTGPFTLRIAAAGRTTLTGLKLDAAGICADAFDFGPGFAVDGRGAGTSTPTDDFSLGADTVTLRKPQIESTYLSTKAIDLAGLRISLVRKAAVQQPCAASGR